ncbi:PIN domain-containing protein [Larkinella soli]|uniref:PIN domain-containing protein n=1 Tax=Larkinella soli TaxID=1770527 RepID=UPI000FFC55A7|nr:PIN domain-containing protein [Larkinella soli]
MVARKPAPLFKVKTFVVDANIVISAMITAGSKAADLLLQPPAQTRFVSCHFLQIELFKHKSKIQQLSGLDEDSLIELLYELLSHIEFINEAYIPFDCWDQANQLLKEIDVKDIPYMALALHLNAPLWTGDRKLTAGLLSRGFDKCVSTSQLMAD